MILPPDFAQQPSILTPTRRTVAALYVERHGVYSQVADVDIWDIDRDARLYAGPHPVVAHPPCERWGRYWYGGPMRHKLGKRNTLGDDSGCFASALESVERWGGVLEHPEASHAWRVFGLDAPPHGGGWISTRVGWTCCVEQGHYGHRARKKTWLYAVRCNPPSLIWGRSRAGVRLDQGYHTRDERRAAQRLGTLRAKGDQRMPRGECAATPIPFRDLLLSIARSSRA